MSLIKSSCIAYSNLALIKYWGNRDEALRLPETNSISFNLEGASTTTTVAFRTDLSGDEIELDGAAVSGAAAARISAQLDLVRGLAETGAHARVASRNDFPSAAGIASSASGFAALTCAACWALGLDLPERELSRLARRGSGSAARSVPGGFVEWQAGTGDADSFAETIAPPEHWPLRDLVAIVTRGAKSVGSTDGHRVAHSSPLFRARIEQVRCDLPHMRQAIYDRDFETLGTLAERDTLMMHAVMLTSEPSLLYWMPETLAVMRAVREWRAQGLACYFSIDAGPNVHVICTPQSAGEALRRLQGLAGVQAVLDCRVGSGTRRTEAHLF